MPAVMLLFPQIGPWNVWDLPLPVWREVARLTDEDQERRRQQHG